MSRCVCGARQTGHSGVGKGGILTLWLYLDKRHILITCAYNCAFAGKTVRVPLTVIPPAEPVVSSCLPPVAIILFFQSPTLASPAGWSRLAADAQQMGKCSGSLQEHASYHATRIQNIPSGMTHWTTWEIRQKSLILVLVNLSLLIYVTNQQMTPDLQRQPVYVWVACHLSSQAGPCGREVDLCDHRNSIGGDEGCGTPRGHEETEVLIVINHFVSYLNHISGSCVCPYVLKMDRKRESATYTGTSSLVATWNLIFFTFIFSSCSRDACNAALPLSCLLFTLVQVEVNNLPFSHNLSASSSASNTPPPPGWFITSWIIYGCVYMYPQNSNCCWKSEWHTRETKTCRVNTVWYDRRAKHDALDVFLWIFFKFY